jgi:hypothetical protein
MYYYSTYTYCVVHVRSLVYDGSLVCIYTTTYQEPPNHRTTEHPTYGRTVEETGSCLCYGLIIVFFFCNYMCECTVVGVDVWRWNHPC